MHDDFVDPFLAVMEFHKRYGVPILSEPGLPSADRIELRKNLMFEELEEICEALERGDILQVAKELADLAYVVYGAGLECGIDLRPAIREVHRSNMTKTPGLYRKDGKCLKGPDYEPPKLESILHEMRISKESK